MISQLSLFTETQLEQFIRLAPSPRVRGKPGRPSKEIAEQKQQRRTAAAKRQPILPVIFDAFAFHATVTDEWPEGPPRSHFELVGPRDKYSRGGKDSQTGKPKRKPPPHIQRIMVSVEGFHGRLPSGDPVAEALDQWERENAGGNFNSRGQPDSLLPQAGLANLPANARAHFDETDFERLINKPCFGRLEALREAGAEFGLSADGELVDLGNKASTIKDEFDGEDELTPLEEAFLWYVIWEVRVPMIQRYWNQDWRSRRATGALDVDPLEYREVADREVNPEAGWFSNEV